MKPLDFATVARRASNIPPTYHNYNDETEDCRHCQHFLLSPSLQPYANMRHPSKSSITLRATLIGIVLIPFNSYWVLHLSYIWDSNRPTSLALLFNVLFTLLVLIGSRCRYSGVYVQSLAFTQSELLTIYAMLCQASVFAGRDMLQVLVPLMGNGFWYATTENEWAQLFHQHLPEWLVVGKQEVLRGFL